MSGGQLSISVFLSPARPKPPKCTSVSIYPKSLRGADGPLIARLAELHGQDMLGNKPVGRPRHTVEDGASGTVLRPDQAKTKGGS